MSAECELVVAMGITIVVIVQEDQERKVAMPTFLRLSKISINVDTIRYVLPGTSQNGEEQAMCVICFVDSSPPHVYYGADAEKVLALIEKHAPLQYGY